MILMKDIIREGHKTLTQVAKPVQLPLSKADKKLLKDLMDFVQNSIDEKTSVKYELRPSVGIAAPQVNISKRMFVIHVEDLDGILHSHAFINPVITSKAKEIIYLPGGEGCLSVTREIEGITPRYYNITVKCHLYDFNTNKLKFITKELEGYPAIVFQHEFDHLNGVLFVDNLENNPKNIEPLFDYETDDNNEEED